jgi:enoyl-CoA hydratase/carnithine racemase
MQGRTETPPEQSVLIEVDGAVMMVTLNRPEARNALTFAMYERLAEICEGLRGDGATKALIIIGAGEKAFAAGTDIAQFRAFRSEEDAHAYEARIESVLSAIESCAVPTIAAISGACTGGGAGIAAACDLRIATRSLRFGFPIARTLGNCLSLENHARLAALIGAGRLMDIILTARLIEADEAKAIGLVSEVLADRFDLLRRARELAVLLAGHAPLTMRATKDALKRIRQGRRDGSDLISLCYNSEDFHEGLEAFLAKRKPTWKGR